MKKNILYIMLACLPLGLISCSDDPDDACSKHVYSADETPYLRIDANATISKSVEFRKGHIAKQTISLKDNAETIQTQLGMTVDDMLAGLESGKVVFYNINTSRAAWNKAAMTKGSTGWYYDASGNITTDASDVASVEIDKTNKCLIVDAPEDAAAGTSISVNVGFAVNNGKDYDKYVRFSLAIAVTDPGLIMPTITIPTGDYASVEINFSDYKTAIETCMGMTVDDFNTAVQSSDGDIAMYMVDESGNWDKTSSYTANGIGYWCTAAGKVQSWGSGCAYFIETHDGSVGIGRYPGMASGSQYKIHFVYASKSDPSKFVEFVVTATMS
jgi:hypothetical protein